MNDREPSERETPLVELVEVSRSFPGVLALDAVSFELCAGEVHAIVGENGAGKSTLINLMSGVLRPDSGTMRLRGATIELANPVAARRLGIFTVHQEAEFFAPLSVAENMALAHGLPTIVPGVVDRRRVDSEARQMVAGLDDPIDIHQPAERLSVVAAAIDAHRQCRPSSGQCAGARRTDQRRYRPRNASGCFARWRALNAAGTGIVYISHRHDEIFALADRITGVARWAADLDQGNSGRHGFAVGCRHGRARRDGRGTCAAKIGQRGVFASKSANCRIAPVECARLISPFARGKCWASMAWSVPDGASLPKPCLESAAPAGGNQGGWPAVCHSQCRRRGRGRFRLSARGSVARRTVPQSVGAGQHGAGESRSLGPRSLGNRQPRRSPPPRRGRWLAIRRRSLEEPIRQLSGGNQQKAVLACWLLTEPRILLLDEPTCGVDVAAKAEIHRILRAWADRGAAVVMISSELPEVMEQADRIVVFREGTVAGEFAPAKSTAAEIASAALPVGGENRQDLGGKSARTKRRWNIPYSEIGLLAVVVVLACCWTRPPIISAVVKT